jgi:Zn-dependent protease
VSLDPSQLLVRLSVTAIPVILAITLHEAAHGFVANRCGDDSALRAGRVTLNPLRHIDLYGTILLPLLLLVVSQGRFMFGYAKPVPVAFARLRRPRRDMVLVAAAGPATNLALALLSAVLLRLCATVSIGTDPGAFATVLAWIAANLYVSILVNAILAIFNMIPLPPLDGGRVAVGLLPEALAVQLARTERYGILILITLIVVVPMIASATGDQFDLLAYVVDRPVNWVMSAMRWVSGMPHD